jgi:hypothetical protein
MLPSAHDPVSAHTWHCRHICMHIYFTPKTIQGSRSHSQKFESQIPSLRPFQTPTLPHERRGTHNAQISRNSYNGLASRVSLLNLMAIEPAITTTTTTTTDVWLCLSMHSYQVLWQRKPFETLNILQLLMSVSALTRDTAGCGFELRPWLLLQSHLSMLLTIWNHRDSHKARLFKRESWWMNTMYDDHW